MATRRKPKKPKKAELKAIGFLGTGKVSAKASKALLTDYVEAQGDVKFVIPITEEYWTNSMAEIATFAENNDILIEAVWDGADENDPEEVLEEDTEFEGVKTKKVADRVIKDSEVVIFLWEDGETEELLDKALAAGLTSLDLAEGLQELDMEEVDEGEEPEAADEDEDDADDSDDGDDEDEDDDEEDGELDPHTDVDSLDTKDDRDQIMALGEALGIETYKGMRVGTMVKEIKKAQKILAAAGADDDEPAAKPAKKKSAPETDEELTAEVVSYTTTNGDVPGRGGVSVVITLDVEDLTEETATSLRDFLAAL